jgi:hypothetical protein
VWWRCPAGPDHEWQAAPLHIGKISIARGNTGCPFCAGLRASVTNSLSNHPQLAAEWHPTANDGLTPADVVAGTGKKLWWRCLENPDHEWQATGANRIRGRGCPMCRKSLRSILEVGIAFELQTVIPGLDLSDDKVVVGGLVRHVDLLLREHHVIIEIDGRYRHDGDVQHERDTAKSQLLTRAGYRLLRLREHPLRFITPNDALLPKDPTIKQATNALLTRLRDLGWLDLPCIDEYLTETEPRRQDAALDHVRAERPGKIVRAPGPVTFTRQERWRDGLAVLLAYVEREGHANVPWEHVEQGFALGQWVGAKRAQHRRGRMSAAREHVLAGLPGWTWDAVEESWETGYQRLPAYRDREGHIRVPTHYRDDDGYPLGVWVRSHRRCGGGRRTITDAQRSRLEALPGWSYDAVKDVFWERAAAAFEAYVARQGRCDTPRHHREDDINIDAWSKQQRAKYHRGELAPHRVARLEAVPGWSWSPQEDAWERGFANLRAHVAEHGTAAVRRDQTRDDYSLGAWVGEQRHRYTRGTLDARRRVRLETMPDWTWDPHAEAWERHFAALQEFVGREGNARVPTDHVEAGLSLASWVIRHRQDHKAGRVPADRATRLAALPGWTWDVLAARWEEQFAALVQYTEREGHARVPEPHFEGELGLGRWVVAQRQARRSGELAAERAARLAGLPGWAWDMREVAWETGFNALQQFQARTGHCRVPSGWLEDSYRLGQWLGVQTGLLAAGRLRGDRAARLRLLLAADEHPGLFPLS